MDILDSNWAEENSKESTLTRKCNYPALERHYTVQEIAKLWGYSRQTVTRIFEHEGGILKIGNPPSKNRRTHITLRIPESILLRMHSRLKS